MASTVTDGTTVITPVFVKGYQASQAGQSITHTVIGSNQPNVTLLAPGLRSGSMALYFGDWSDAEACRQLHLQPLVFTFADSDVTSADMTYFVSSAGLQIELDEDSLYWILTVGFQEVLT